MRWLALLLWLIPALAGAQDKGFLASTLEQSLSGPGRVVTVTGFAGALSSKATMTELTVADSAGVWMTLRGVVLDWNRAALLSGRVEVTTLTADEIIVTRPPLAAPTAAPSAEAGGFSLPDLPVSVSIGKIAATRVELGAPLLGTAAVVTVSGALQLAGGEGKATLDIHRIDGTRGAFALDASYANATRQLALTLTTDEAAQGLLTTMIGLPGAPALSLSIQGTGPIDAYGADIRLATDGQDRLTGNVTLATAAAAAGAVPTRTFTATLAGDIAPLFAPEYATFFGPNISLNLAGVRQPDGAVTLSALRLVAQAIDITGTVRVGADGLPDLLDLSGRIGAADGAPVLLPLPGAQTRLNSADLRLTFDRAKGDGWQGNVAIVALNRPDLTAQTLTLSGTGHIARQAGGGAVDGTLDFAGQGVVLADAALAQALGDAVQGRVRFGWQTNSPLTLPEVTLTGAGYGLTASGQVDGLDKALTVTGSAQMTADDLSRLSALAGRSLGGAGSVTVKGSAAVLAGSFDLDATVTGQDLRAGQPELDSLLRGASTVHLSAARDETGTTLRTLSVTAATLTATASGHVASDAADVNATLDFTDLSALGGRYAGGLNADLHYTLAAGNGTLTLTGTGRDLAIGQPETDRLLHGQTKLDVKASRIGGKTRIDSFTLTNPQLDAKATANLSGAARRIDLSAKLANLALIAPGFPGALTVGGSVTEADAGYSLDLKATGPGGLSAALGGSLAADFRTVDLAAKGSVESGIVNGLIEPRSIRGPARFDLRLKGAPALSALSGTVTLGPARLAAPTLGLSADPVTATVTLAGGRAKLTAKATVGGGTVTVDGPVALTAPFPANLTVALSNVGLKNPDLFTTRLSGNLTLDGPLTGGAAIAGRLRMGQTELRVPSTGLGGDAMIADLGHIGASAEVQATRARAGLVASTVTAGQSRAIPYGLDLTISAPNQVFIRGRGLDAELGGTVVLGGTTANVIPSGGFDLLRGRLDILGKRFDLSQASLRLEGRFVPYVQIAASSLNDGVTSTITIEGEATDPKITFSSSPPLPQEEVLSQLLFGHGLAKISPFQAAQLASAVATLAGKGGEGIVGKLRQGFGLDNLDVTTDATGGAAVKAGKYLSKRIYSEVTLGSDGKTVVDLNLTVTKSVTARGSASSDGTTSLGIYYDRDY